MNKEINRYLKDKNFTDPQLVDRLIVSSFLKINDILVNENVFIKSFIISEDKTEVESLKKFIEIININGFKFDFEALIELFEFVISPDEKVVTGAIYTPINIRTFIINQVFKNINFTDSARIADIACGCGSFLYDLAIYIHNISGHTYTQIFKNNLFGLDIQEYSIIRTKILLSLLAIQNGEDIPILEFNLFVGDALNFKWSDVIANFEGFQSIIGNPPYVCSRNIPQVTKQYLKNWEVCSTGHPDLYIPFFQIALENLINNGVLGYITMNSFFKSLNGRALRSYFQQKKYSFKIIDFGNQQIFKSKSTYTCLCFIEKQSCEFLQYYKNQNKELSNNMNYSKLYYDTFDSVKGWNLEIAEVINKIEKTGRPFGDIYKTRNGIATLKNNIYIFNPIKEDDNFYYLKNGIIFPIEKEICVDIINPNKFTKINNVDDITEKVIFPYKYKGDRVNLITEEYFKTNYPQAYHYLSVKKEILAGRDKGNATYENWFAFGRNQSLEKMRNKLFFPHITPHTPNFVINTDENLLFRNGLAVVVDEEKELLFLQKLMASDIFWLYIKNSSRPYGSGYYSLSKNYIKNFGVYDFTEEQKDYIVNEKNIKKTNKFIMKLYDIE
ncbi:MULTISPECIES: N-6 DNA methylase [unclassified Flavobacterium]|uniref:Eco57I restriction-modification methylase domain-containing protein n=1 Tax=unclassified Flavobacterium TaxID=196869 RepID=UPI00095F9961|nr:MULTISPECIES: N-6 DNA methylase [unclassified Flavobacterium]MBN9285554.1 Eco57I restriction-modification methylase domain-containing protein [Flavobacterium sp.]OJV71088.1 MAG: N-6 DNA methylase [Flavobacterium sp. 40-81]